MIDEAGMADTISLAQICSWAVEQGASVRLIGDDQQLAAIGAGGVLRDIQTTHGAVQLTELMRFTDPAESAASLALRNGDVSALGFYLDNQRVHVGDLATMTSQAFDAWRADTGTGLDSIMLAPPATSSTTSTSKPAPTTSPPKLVVLRLAARSGSPMAAGPGLQFAAEHYLGKP